MTDTRSDAPLDRPIWHSLTGRHAALALGDSRAVRFRPDVNLFGAAADESPEALDALAGLIAEGGTLGLLGVGAAAPLPGTVVVSERRLNQMVATRLNRAARAVEIVPLGDADAGEMLDLATLTAPGPFFAKTHLQGGYIGVRRGGRLVAMAGERMKVPGFSEISAVCTHPDYRGQGFARALMEAVLVPLLERGEGVFLHSYADNPAVALYRALGFEVRREMTYTVVARG
ncbi:GNAT family N-acetyltransferase [Sphingomonas sp. TREG-RG-20F-R18-01]|uniref:GNAT family N-acetyltransferase n=1 Tax=Sphingomonas sp. TREG-RG-20F-R18-01 TaxID=2914982 RepID=UPI001F59B114|nr:GNAT family N-acetyltransferase [Sphingomonas sp. TREG-RG-20F-R18-01]